MWTVHATGDSIEIYRLLKQNFHYENVIMEEYEYEQRKRYEGGRVDTVTMTKNRATTEEGASEQFRYVLKLVQNLMVGRDGTYRVEASGDGTSLKFEIEAV